MCNLIPIRLTGSPPRAASIEECDSSRGVDHGDRPAADHLDPVVRAEEGRRVLVEADPDRERIVGQRGEQAAQPVALAEMLVDDRSGW